MAPMDIWGFYGDDPRRRRTEEIDLRKRWTDGDGNNYLLSWVHDTGELYLMRDMIEWGQWILESGSRPLPDTVIILAEIQDRGRLDEVLSGWDVEMDRSDSVTWLCARLSDAGLLVNDPRTQPDSSASDPADPLAGSDGAPPESVLPTDPFVPGAPVVEYDLHKWPRDAIFRTLAQVASHNIPYHWDLKAALLTVPPAFEEATNRLVLDHE